MRCSRHKLSYLKTVTQLNGKVPSATNRVCSLQNLCKNSNGRSELHWVGFRMRKATSWSLSCDRNSSNQQDTLLKNNCSRISNAQSHVCLHWLGSPFPHRTRCSLYSAKRRSKIWDLLNHSSASGASRRIGQGCWQSIRQIFESLVEVSNPCLERDDWGGVISWWKSFRDVYHQLSMRSSWSVSVKNIWSEKENMQYKDNYLPILLSLRKN